MPSTIGWLDHSEEQQDRMREVISLFAETGTVDDIGIGVMRDVFADLLVPGLTTLQTRVRYFLFVPWVFQRLDAERVSSAAAEERARSFEISLIYSLLAGGAQEGVIGSVARDGLKQLPSYAYWNGLEAFGTRRFTGTRADYFRSMDAFHDRARNDDGSDTPRRWHAHLPDPPDDLWQQTTLDLTEEEASYLQERIIASQPDSLTAHLLHTPAPIDSTIRLPWHAVSIDDVDQPLAERLAFAQVLSEAIHGASSLYNLMLAEDASARSLPRADEWESSYRDQVETWVQLSRARRDAHAAMDRRAFWATVTSRARISPQTREFVDLWLDAATTVPDVAGDHRLRDAIRTRERQLKKGLARLSNPRALETWQGASAAGQLDFRWPTLRSAINDIARGLGVA